MDAENRIAEALESIFDGINRLKEALPGKE